MLSCLAVHDLTIIRHVLGEIPTPQCSYLSREGGLATGICAVLGRGLRAVLSVSARHAGYYRTVCLHGSRGTLALVDPLADHVIYRDAAGEEKIPFQNSMPLFDELAEFLGYLRGRGATLRPGAGQGGGPSLGRPARGGARRRAGRMIPDNSPRLLSR